METHSTSPAAQMAKLRAALGMLDPSDTQAQSLGRLQEITQIQGTLAAIQAEETALIEELRHEEEAAQGIAKKGYPFRSR